MKLRNKKTGDIVYVDFQVPLTNNGEVLDYCIVPTLKELNESFEDYKPKEPLIKDPKIRKAVRAWAEAHEAKTILARKDFAHFEFEGYSIEFPTAKPSDYIEFYAIDELCGEEEE